MHVLIYIYTYTPHITSLASKLFPVAVADSAIFRYELGAGDVFSCPRL